MGNKCCTKEETHDFTELGQSPFTTKEGPAFHYYIPIQTLANHVKSISMHPSKPSGKLKPRDSLADESSAAVAVSPALVRKPTDILSLETATVTTARENNVTFITFTNDMRKVNELSKSH